MAGNKNSKQSRKRKQQSKGRRLFWWACKRLLLLSVVTGLGFLVVVDYQVREKFSGSKWELPAHVYSRPLELYQGQSLARDELVWELQALGYKRTRSAQAAGQFSVASQRVEVFSRGFDFWDGAEPSQRMMIHFSGGSIGKITDRNSDALPLARLEPLIIGGVYPSQSEDRELLRLTDLPDYIPLGLLAVEDRSFYRHYGVSPRGISRAMVSNIREGRVVQGGSTLTQQLVKNFYLDQRQTLSRKAVEAVMALLLELHFDKDQILEAYLNEVYLGQSGRRSINGFGLASRHYFNRPISELDLHQAALLIGMVKGASFYNPRKHPERAKKRRNLVLAQMVEQGVIKPQQGRRAKQQPLGLQAGSVRLGQFPDYLDLVKRQLKQDYDEADLLTGGLKVFTNFDPQVQRKLEQSIERRVGRIERDYRLADHSIEAASVIMRVGTAEVVALSGGRKAGYSGFNRALDARRPVGSTLKPAVMLAALEQPSRYTLSTLIDDSPLTVSLANGQQWAPQNYERTSHGQVPLYEVLAQSYNQATARLGMDVGIDNIADVIYRLGYQRPFDPVPAITLGAVDMAPVEVAEMYHTIAANGFYSPLRAIQTVYDSDYNPLQRYSYQVEQRFSPAVAHLLHYAMQVVMREGTGKTAYKSLPVEVSLAGKTGTTNGQRDSWFAGFGGNYMAVMWLGKDNNGKMPVSGGTGALQVWTDLMRDIDVQSFPFVQPEGIGYHWVEPDNAVLSGRGCPGARKVPYLNGSQPQQRGRCFKGGGERVFEWLKDVFGL